MTAVLSLEKKLEEIGAGMETMAALHGNVREEILEAGDNVLRQGDHAPNLFFLASGLVKLTYLTANGNEFTKSFIDEGNFMGSLVSLLEGGASPFSIICLERSRVESLPYTLLKSLIDEDVAMLRFICFLYQNLALKKEIREFDFLCLTPAQRYEKFLKNTPSTASRITQAEIARYLGITPVALSRIKTRLGRQTGKSPN